MSKQQTSGAAPDSPTNAQKQNRTTHEYLSMVDKWCKACKRQTTTLDIWIAPSEWLPLREAMVMRNSTFARAGIKTQHVSSPTIMRPRKQIKLLYAANKSTITFLIDDKK